MSDEIRQCRSEQALLGSLTGRVASELRAAHAVEQQLNRDLSVGGSCQPSNQLCGGFGFVQISFARETRDQQGTG